MNDRLVKLMDVEQLSSSKFADIIGVQRSSVSHVLSGRNKPSYIFLQKTLEAFPMVSAEWLILGKGSMYKDEQNMSVGNLFNQPSKIVENQNKTGVSSNESTDKSEIPGNFTDGDARNLSPRESNNSEMIDDSIKTNQSKGRKVIEKDVEEKVIDKIVIFYHDNTFQSYTRSD